MTRTTRCCLRNLSRLAFAMESSASTSSAASSSSFSLASSLSETSSRLFQKRLATRAGARRVVPSSSSIATASRVVFEHKEHKDGKEDDDVKTIAVTFTEKTGEEITVRAKVGESLMEAAHENDVELEGACEGSLACSTCHVIVEDQAVFDKLPEACDDENDMLDLAFGLTETSRLGCQIIAKEDIDGIRVKIPAATRNFAVDGFVPKPH